jgi:hypothetical protein
VTVRIATRRLLHLTRASDVLRLVHGGGNAIGEPAHE